MNRFTKTRIPLWEALSSTVTGDLGFRTLVYFYPMVLLGLSRKSWVTVASFSSRLQAIYCSLPISNKNPQEPGSTTQFMYSLIDFSTWRCRKYGHPSCTVNPSVWVAQPVAVLLRFRRGNQGVCVPDHHKSGLWVRYLCVCLSCCMYSVFFLIYPSILLHTSITSQIHWAAIRSAFLY